MCFYKKKFIMSLKKKINLFSFRSILEENVIISYKGPFDRHILFVIGDYIKTTIGKNSKASKKIFNIFIELAQNISYYSAEINKLDEKKEIGVGTLVIGDHKNYYTFRTGNVVKKNDIIPIINKCELINSLDRDSLRKFKREQRALPPSENDGAHIGLIKVALTSSNPLDFQITNIDDDFSYFSISVKINK
ncbi:MAG: hypothetical protein B6I24_02975 [Bacteroidetes bacterium 4572_128]|nr:MAG: hypothetical protein B6I24_02975 [Bacteroidetes bacterium 4572_128]